jgi:hypothetical protein
MGEAPEQKAPRFGVTADDLRQYEWQSHISEERDKDCTCYMQLFSKEAKTRDTEGDDLGRRVYSLLGVVCSFFPDYDYVGNPYGPLWTKPNGDRALMADDLEECDLEALSGTLDTISDPEMRARVGDILWECRKDYRAAEVAVRAFLEAAQDHKTDDLWPPYVDRLQRAAQLSAKLGFGKQLHQEVVAAIEEAIKEFEHNPQSGLLCCRLMHLAMAHGVTDYNRYSATAERLAAENVARDELDFSEDYWQVAALCYRRADNDVEAQRCRLAAAECFIAKADAGMGSKNLGFGYASHWLSVGLRALRQANASPERTKEIHLRLLEVQKKSIGECTPLELDIDAIPGFRDAEKTCQDAATAHVTGCRFQEAVIRLALISKPTSVDALRERVEKHSEEFIWDKIVDTVALDGMGKTAGRMPPLHSANENAQESAMRTRMVHAAKETDWQIQVVWKIDPARRTILHEHGVRRYDLAFLLASNPFIPPGHEGICVRGIQAGFLGDWLVAMNLLIPQFEASIRHVLQQHKVVTSTLMPDQVQQERDINQLLWLPECSEIFGPDIVFDLRGMLIERFGFNMRNESAHGLMGESEFYQYSSVYIWWLFIHLCWIGASAAMISSESMKNS